VSLNDVEEGGLTRFGRLKGMIDSKEEGEMSLTVQPKRGDALLFFPADAMGGLANRARGLSGC
jgi:hypothetical protein